jgi:two-component system response regulator YesN
MKEVKNEVGVFVEQIGQVKEKNNAKLINVAKKHVKENYGEKITLEDAAGLVYLSPAYFGILFKKETGLNFSEYISRVKIKKAKDFLRNQKYKISEVGEMVGYKDTKYFSKLFRRITGIKPTEYRKIHLLRDKL